MNSRILRAIVVISAAFILARIWSVWHTGLGLSLLSDDYVQLGRAAWPGCLLPHQWFYRYTPVPESIFVAVKSIFGWQTLAFRAVGMALYISCIPLIVVFAYRTTRDWLIAFAACALFVTYPFSHEMAFWTIAQYGYCVELASLLIGALIVMKASAKGFTTLSGIALVATYIVGLGAHEQMIASLPIWVLMWWLVASELDESRKFVVPKGTLPVAAALVAVSALCVLAKALFTKSMIIVDSGPLWKLGNCSRMHYMAFRIDSLSFSNAFIGAGLLMSVLLSVWALWSLRTRYRLWGIMILSLQLSLVPSVAFSGLSPRYLYLPSVFSSILLGMILAGVRSRLDAGLRKRLGAAAASLIVGLLFCAVVVAISLSGVRFLESQARCWREASRLSGKMTSEVVELVVRQGVDKDRIVIANPPDRVKAAWCDGAYIFRNGLQYAVGYPLGQRGITKPIEVVGRSAKEPLLTTAQEQALAADGRALVIDCSGYDRKPCRVVQPASAIENGGTAR